MSGPWEVVHYLKADSYECEAYCLAHSVIVHTFFLSELCLKIEFDKWILSILKKIIFNSNLKISDVASQRRIFER